MFQTAQHYVTKKCKIGKYDYDISYIQRGLLFVRKSETEMFMVIVRYFKAKISPTNKNHKNKTSQKSYDPAYHHTLRLFNISVLFVFFIHVMFLIMNINCSKLYQIIEDSGFHRLT